MFDSVPHSQQQDKRAAPQTCGARPSPGNVLLETGEANLPKQRVVNVTQVLTVDKKMLVDWIGRLFDRRVQQILAGLRRVTEPRHL